MLASETMSAESEWPVLLRHCLESDRIHSAYLLAGPVDVAMRAAIRFARGIACIASDSERPCEACASCQRSGEQELIAIDGTGKTGPFYRHIGDHPDLFWLDRGDSTRVRIGQVRELQSALRLGSHEGGWRVVLIADAQWLNPNAQNALLHLLEEPPDRTSLLLVTPTASALLATIRSRCQRVRFAPAPPLTIRGSEVRDEIGVLAQRFDRVGEAGFGELLDWAEEYRGNRSAAAENVEELLATGVEWLRERVDHCVRQESHRSPAGLLTAFDQLSQCRRDLAQRNANPRMVAERAFFAMRRAVLS